MCRRKEIRGGAGEVLLSMVLTDHTYSTVRRRVEWTDKKDRAGSGTSRQIEESVIADVISSIAVKENRDLRSIGVAYWMLRAHCITRN